MIIITIIIIIIIMMMMLCIQVIISKLLIKREVSHRNRSIVGRKLRNFKKIRKLVFNKLYKITAFVINIKISKRMSLNLKNIRDRLQNMSKNKMNHCQFQLIKTIRINKKTITINNQANNYKIKVISVNMKIITV